MAAVPHPVYFLVVLPPGLAVTAYGLARWARVRWPPALAMTAAGVVGELAMALFLTAGLGLTTPGS